MRMLDLIAETIFSLAVHMALNRHGDDDRRHSRGLSRPCPRRRLANRAGLLHRRSISRCPRGLTLLLGRLFLSAARNAFSAGVRFGRPVAAVVVCFGVLAEPARPGRSRPQASGTRQEHPAQLKSSPIFSSVALRRRGKADLPLLHLRQSGLFGHVEVQRRDRDHALGNRGNVGFLLGQQRGPAAAEPIIGRPNGS